jgi:hypothetical protein
MSPFPPTTDYVILLARDSVSGEITSILSKDGKIISDSDVDLAEIKNRIGALTLPAAGSTNKLLAEVKSAIEGLSFARPEIVSLNVDFSSAAEQTLVAAQGAGKVIWVYGLEFSALDNIEIAVKNGATTVRTYRGVSISGPAVPFPLSANTALKVQATTSDRITGGISYLVVG